MPTTNFGKVVVDTNMIPYIRPNEVEFAAHNLKPFKLSNLFFDDIGVNIFCQGANRMLLDSKKVITLSRNNATTVTADDIVYQGTSNTVNTFNGIIESFYSANSTIVVRRLDGAFDKDSQLFIENVSTGITYANCNVTSFVNKDTADVFYPGEGVVATNRNNGYATVVATSGENILYLNKNYISLNVTAVGSNNITAMTNDFKVGDIVYQTFVAGTAGSKRYDYATFRGVVKYYNPLGETGMGSIAIDPLHGKINVNAASSSSNGLAYLWNTSNPTAQPLGVKEINLADFASNSNVQSVTNSTIKINVSSWVHRSGVSAGQQGENSSVVILNSGSGLNPANGNLIYFVAGTGIGQLRRVVGTSANGVAGALQLNSAISFSPDCTTHYSTGNFETDAHGTLAGVFHIPSVSNFKFKTGERIFTITDTNTVTDTDYTMRAAAIYSAGGILKSTQRIQTTPNLPPLPEVDADSLVRPMAPADRTYNGASNKSPVTGSTASTVPRVPLGDGLSQTFSTPKPEGNKSDYGIFVSSIDLFFKNKPAPGGFFNNSRLQKRSSMQLPVTVKIAEVQNGYPTKNYLAQKTLQAKDVNVSDLPSTSNAATLTKFSFDDPVYLEPSREYAITIQSDSPDYELFIAELGQDVLGASPPRRISEQPYAGVLFRSQNSSTWSPYQNQDLMFVLNKAVFATSGTATFNLDETPMANTDVDRVMLISTDLTFPAANVQYRLKGVYTSNSAYEAGTGIPLLPHRPIEYGLIADASGKSSTALNRRRVLRGNANSYILTTELTTTDPDISPVVNYDRLAAHLTTFYINNGGLSNTLISITNAGSGYNAITSTASANVHGSTMDSLNVFAQLYRETYLANSANVGLYSARVYGGGGIGCIGFAVANTDGSNTIDHIVLASGGGGFVETPTIAIASGNATSYTQAYASINGETDQKGGNMLARYITREVVLEEGFESGDLRVFMDVIRPAVTDVQVYYKIVSGDDVETISSKRWRRMGKVKDIASKDGRTLIGLEFRPSLVENRISYVENGTNYPIGGTFKSFQIKVCLMSADPSVVPKIKNLRITAIPEG
jgi:hypothetical protein